jgi:hypothetical protein
MTELSEIARRARRALAGAETATLLIQGIGRFGPVDPAVVMQDDNGRPMFWCEPTSAIATAAGQRRSAMLTVPSPGADEFQTVVIAGRLAITRVVHLEDGAEVNLIALTPTQVFVEHDDHSNPRVVQYEIPLELYTSSEPGALDSGHSDSDEAGPEAFTTFAAGILEHTNSDHQHELRHFIAGRRDIPISLIAGVSLVELDCHGAQLRWVDAVGAHQTAIVFAEPATTPNELSYLLGAYLRVHHRQEST